MTQVTARAAAHRLGVGYSTLKNWIRLGQIRTTKTPGGHHRVSEAEIERLIARQPASASVSAQRRAPPAGLLVALSGRNRLHGFIEEIRVDGLLAQVRLRVGDQMLTAVITRDAVQELRLKRGDDAVGIVKSTEVMIAREVTTAARTASRRGRR